LFIVGLLILATAACGESAENAALADREAAANAAYDQAYDEAWTEGCQAAEDQIREDDPEEFDDRTRPSLRLAPYQENRAPRGRPVFGVRRLSGSPDQLL
jgi:hypothetical protein